ncbi:hypothetical protein [Nonomuraea polychroma]|nr:hypothetical protein [Nonomuraea polychroma]
MRLEFLLIEALHDEAEQLMAARPPSRAKSGMHDDRRAGVAGPGLE